MNLFCLVLGGGEEGLPFSITHVSLPSASSLASLAHLHTRFVVLSSTMLQETHTHTHTQCLTLLFPSLALERTFTVAGAAMNGNTHTHR